jgi:hypothetical protein
MEAPETPTPGQQWYAWFVAHGKQEQPRWDEWSREQQAILERVAHLTWASACTRLFYASQPPQESHEPHAEA